MIHSKNAIYAHAQHFVASDKLLLPILKAFVQCTCSLHFTRNAWCFQSVRRSRQSVPSFPPSPSQRPTTPRHERLTPSPCRGSCRDLWTGKAKQDSKRLTQWRSTQILLRRSQLHVIRLIAADFIYGLPCADFHELVNSQQNYVQISYKIDQNRIVNVESTDEYKQVHYQQLHGANLSSFHCVISLSFMLYVQNNTTNKKSVNSLYYLHVSAYSLAITR
jgi:hypothetical protein